MDIIVIWISNNLSYFEMFLKLFLAAIVGGFIGYQRENTHRPAGLRTHILVCVGSALVMVTSEYIYERYKGTTTLDPARLGAQVISGIGFLGAGTILRDGSTIKGLTTAAGLWAVSCIGIAIGAGFYFGGISAAVLVYITLLLSKDFDVGLDSKNSIKKIKIIAANRPGFIGEIENTLTEVQISIRSIKIISKKSDSIKLLIAVICPSNITHKKILNTLCNIEGTQKVY